VSSEALGVGEHDYLEPELCDLAFAPDMDVRRLATFVAVKEEAIRTHGSDVRHDSNSRMSSSRTGAPGDLDALDASRPAFKRTLAKMARRSRTDRVLAGWRCYLDVSVAPCHIRPDYEACHEAEIPASDE